MDDDDEVAEHNQADFDKRSVISNKTIKSLVSKKKDKIKLKRQFLLKRKFRIKFLIFRLRQRLPPPIDILIARVRHVPSLTDSELFGLGTSLGRVINDIFLLVICASQSVSFDTICSYSINTKQVSVTNAA
jgi:hypothetical protein